MYTFSVLVSFSYFATKENKRPPWGGTGSFNSWEIFIIRNQENLSTRSWCENFMVSLLVHFINIWIFRAAELIKRAKRRWRPLTERNIRTKTFWSNDWVWGSIDFPGFLLALRYQKLNVIIHWGVPLFSLKMFIA